MKVLAFSQDGYSQWVHLEFFKKGAFIPRVMKWHAKYLCCPVSFKAP